MFGVDALAAHPAPETRVVETAVAYFPYPVQDFLLPVGEVSSQPVLEERRDCVRQPNGCVSGGFRSGIGGGAEYLRQFVIRKSGDHGRDEDAHRDSRLREAGDRGKSPLRAGRARLHPAAQVVIERRQGDGYGGGIAPRKLLQQVYIPRDQKVLRNDTDRVSEFRKHFEAAAGESEFLLYRLVAVGGDAQGDGSRSPLLRGEFTPQEFGRVFFDHDPRLEIQPSRHAEIFVVGTGEAIYATMTASPVRVDARVEADIRASVRRDDGFRSVAIVDCFRLWFLTFFGVEVVEVGRVCFDFDALEAVLRVARRSASGYVSGFHELSLTGCSSLSNSVLR